MKISILQAINRETVNNSMNGNKTSAVILSKF